MTNPPSSDKGADRPHKFEVGSWRWDICELCSQQTDNPIHITPSPTPNTLDCGCPKGVCTCDPDRHWPPVCCKECPMIVPKPNPEGWEKEFEKYVYQEAEGGYVHTKVNRVQVEHDLFELKPAKGSTEHVVKLLVWYGVTNPNLVRDVLDLLAQRDQATLEFIEKDRIELVGPKGFYGSEEELDRKIDFQTAYNHALDRVKAYLTKGDKHE